MHTQTQSHSQQPRCDRAEQVQPSPFIERLKQVIEQRLAELEPFAEQASQLEERLAALREAD